ncbi:Uncharacterised protein [Raoultella planticola]|nr:Uncharacterised protein [Raoultella planticola]
MKKMIKIQNHADYNDWLYFVIRYPPDKYREDIFN